MISHPILLQIVLCNTQVISALLKDSEDKTKINLLFANNTAKDIILKDELEALAAAHPDRFKITYVIDAAAEGWTGETGYITADLIKKHLPEAGSVGNKVFVCGPPRKSNCSLIIVT